MYKVFSHSGIEHADNTSATLHSLPALLLMSLAAALLIGITFYVLNRHSIKDKKEE